MPDPVIVADVVTVLAGDPSLVGPGQGGVLLHPGHGDPVSPDPVTSASIRLGIAALAGLVGALVALVPATRLWNGDVPAVLLVALATGRSLVDVSNLQAGLALAAVGVVLGALGQGVGMAVFGLEGISVAAAWLTLQAILATVVAVALLYFGVAYLLVPRFEGEVSSVSDVRDDWLVCAGVYAVAFLATKVAVFTAIYGA